MGRGVHSYVMFVLISPFNLLFCTRKKTPFPLNDPLLTITPHYIHRASEIPSLILSLQSPNLVFSLSLSVSLLLSLSLPLPLPPNSVKIILVSILPHKDLVKITYFGFFIVKIHMKAPTLLQIRAQYSPSLLYTLWVFNKYSIH